mmetsp:Transcript_3402/g.2855  ORF Transcript_3402/g.2855 Transcript_3402/m.2855 type:complete len:163 (+) Transcript_3402:412-900(+)
MFNDSPASNRFYAYLANIQITEFNKLEMEVLKRLSFNALISAEDYRNYEEALESFCQNKSGVLAKCYSDYKHDKKILKEIKQEISNQQLTSVLETADHCLINNYQDTQLNQIFEKKPENGEYCHSMESTKEFRFESYNSHTFKEKCRSIRKSRSRSVPSILS